MEWIFKTARRKKSECRIVNEKNLLAGDEETWISRPPRVIDPTVPRISDAAIGGSLAAAVSPRRISCDAPAPSSLSISRWVHRRPLRTNSTSSPRDGSASPGARTINSSPGHSVGSMLLPATRTRTSLPARAASAMSSHPMRSRLFSPASNQHRRFTDLIAPPALPGPSPTSRSTPAKRPPSRMNCRSQFRWCRPSRAVTPRESPQPPEPL